MYFYEGDVPVSESILWYLMDVFGTLFNVSENMQRIIDVFEDISVMSLRLKVKNQIFEWQVHNSIWFVGALHLYN